MRRDPERAAHGTALIGDGRLSGKSALEERAQLHPALELGDAEGRVAARAAPVQRKELFYQRGRLDP